MGFEPMTSRFRARSPTELSRRALLMVRSDVEATASAAGKYICSVRGGNLASDHSEVAALCAKALVSVPVCQGRKMTGGRASIQFTSPAVAKGPRLSFGPPAIAEYHHGDGASDLFTSMR